MPPLTGPLRWTPPTMRLDGWVPTLYCHFNQSRASSRAIPDHIMHPTYAVDVLALFTFLIQEVAVLLGLYLGTIHEALDLILPNESAWCKGCHTSAFYWDMRYYSDFCLCKNMAEGLCIRVTISAISPNWALIEAIILAPQFQGCPEIWGDICHSPGNWLLARESHPFCPSFFCFRLNHSLHSWILKAISSWSDVKIVAWILYSLGWKSDVSIKSWHTGLIYFKQGGDLYQTLMSNVFGTNIHSY